MDRHDLRSQRRGYQEARDQPRRPCQKVVPNDGRQGQACKVASGLRRRVTVDPTNERAIQEALAQLVSDKTLIVVAHKLSTIQAADQILVLDQGKLVERGTHDALVAHGGLYGKLWAHRARAATWQIGGLQ